MGSDQHEQGKLFQKVVNISDIRPQDKETGQHKLFGTTEEFVPGFTEWAGLMNEKLHQSTKQNEALIKKLDENAIRLDESTAQSKRLANSLEKVIPKFLDQSVNHTNPDIVFGHLPQGKQADVAIADGTQVLAESLYILTTGEIADRIGNKSMTANRMSLLLRDLRLFGDSKFHHTLKTGRKGFCQKYKPSTIDEIYARLQKPDHYGIGLGIAEKYADFIKPRGIQA